MRARSVVVFITGFREDASQVTGIEDIWAEARKHASPDAWILPPMVWNSDWKAQAQLIERHTHIANTRICVVAYSWGAGYGFTQLAKHLARCNIRVAEACLADPVYRSRFIPFRWLALTDLPRIRIPANVGRVSWVRQRQNRPRAHDLVASNPETQIGFAQELKLRHGQIDNSLAFRTMSAKAIARTIAPPIKTDEH